MEPGDEPRDGGGTSTRVLGGETAQEAREPDVGPRDEPGPTRGRWWTRGPWYDLAAAAVTLLVAFWVTGPLWVDVRHRRLGPYPFDHGFFEWVFGHGVRVVTEGTNPFFTTQLNAPDGVNMMANNSQLGLAIPLAPVTMLFGPEVTFALVLTGSLAGAAFGWYWVLSRHLVSSRLGALLGGLVCAFGPGVMTHAGGQLNMMTNFLLPFIVWRSLALRQPGRAVRNGVWLALLVVWQVFIAEEPLLLTALGVGVFMWLYALLDRNPDRAELKTVATGLGVCAVVAGVLLAYPLYYQFFGPEHYRGIMEVASNFSATVGSFTGRTLPWIGHSGSAQDDLTWPLTAVTILVGVVLWREVRVRALVLTSIPFAILALGPRITTGSLKDTPLPYLPLSKLPVFDAVVPARLQLVCMIIAGVLLAFGWDRLASRPPRGAWLPVRRLGFAAALVLLFPAIPAQVQATPSAPAPAFVTEGTWREFVPEGRTLVPLPVPSMGYVEWMRWSASTGLDIALPGGYFFGPSSDTDLRAWYSPEERPTTVLARQIGDGAGAPPMTDELKKSIIDDLRYWRAAAVVVGPHERMSDLRLLMVQAFGEPQESGGIWVWDVRGLV